MPREYTPVVDQPRRKSTRSPNPPRVTGNADAAAAADNDDDDEEEDEEVDDDDDEGAGGTGNARI